MFVTRLVFETVRASINAASLYGSPKLPNLFLEFPELLDIPALASRGPLEVKVASFSEYSQQNRQGNLRHLSAKAPLFL